MNIFFFKIVGEKIEFLTCYHEKLNLQIITIYKISKYLLKLLASHLLNAEESKPITLLHQQIDQLEVQSVNK